MASAEKCLGRSGNFRPGFDHYPPRNPHHAILRSDPRTRGHGPRCFLSSIWADGREVAVGHFKNLRAVVSMGALLPSVLPKPSNKHK